MLDWMTPYTEQNHPVYITPDDQCLAQVDCEIYATYSSALWQWGVITN